MLEIHVHLDCADRTLVTHRNLQTRGLEIANGNRLNGFVHCRISGSFRCRERHGLFRIQPPVAVKAAVALGIVAPA